MLTTTINAEDENMAPVDVFTTGPERQQEPIDVLTEATDVTLQIDGSISANEHCNCDGRRVVNYAQWQTAEHFAAMLAVPQASPHVRQTAELASYDPVIANAAYVGRV